MINNNYSNNWSPIIQQALFSNLGEWLVEVYNKKTVFPIKDNVFKAFKLTPYENVKVIIIGKEPYLDYEFKSVAFQKDPIVIPLANGLAFSVSKGRIMPKTLQNIFKAIEYDLGIKNTNSDLSKWAEQGVLLLNTALTVEKNMPNSHLKQWESFINNIINKLNEHPNRLIFVFWDEKATDLLPKINIKKHIVFTGIYPAAKDNSFVTCRQFSEINQALIALGQNPINWKTD